VSDNGLYNYNPYAANGGSPNTETVTLDVVMRLAVQAGLLDVHTALPGKVVKVTANNQVSVQPMLRRKYVNGQVLDIPTVLDVPVWVPRGSDYWIKLPVAVNDTGLLVFSERSLDKWKVNANNGNTLDPQDNRKFDYSDAIFFPGLYPFNNQVPGNAEDMVLHNGDAEIYVLKPGTFKITNGTVELIDLTQRIAGQTESLTTDTSVLMSALSVWAAAVGATNPSLTAPTIVFQAALTAYIAELSTIATELATIQTELGEIKG